MAVLEIGQNGLDATRLVEKVSKSVNVPATLLFPVELVKIVKNLAPLVKPKVACLKIAQVRNEIKIMVTKFLKLEFCCNLVLGETLVT